MKKINLIAIAGIGLLFVSCNGSRNSTSASAEQETAVAKGEVFDVDTATSYVYWKAYHKGGFAPRWGKLFLSSGELSAEGGNLNSGEFVINMKSLKVDPESVTENGKKYTELESHLKSADFFDVEKNPTGGFVVTKIEDLKSPVKDAVEGANFTVSGNLTLQGRIKNVTFPAKVEFSENSVLINAKFTVNRTDWGIKFGTSEADPAEWMISKDIEIEILVKGKK